MSAAPVLKYKNADVPRQAGEVGRLRVLGGPDRGLIYLIRKSSVIVGRGEKSEVCVTDLKASRAHARLDFTSEGWVLNDLGSANGIFHHGEYLRKVKLKTGDHFTIGETIFEFIASSEATRVLTAPLRPASEVAHQEQALGAQRLRVKSYSQGATPVSQTQKKQNPLRTLMLLGGAVGFYFYTAPPAPKKAEPIQKKEPQEKSLQSYLPEGVSKEVSRTADRYYRQGFREYRERNYLRARAQFELVLQVDPTHELASHYLKVAEHEIDVEIKKMISSAQKAQVAGRLQEAKGYYETAMRLMYFDRSNPDFLECEEGIKIIKKELNRDE